LAKAAWDKLAVASLDKVASGADNLARMDLVVASLARVDSAKWGAVSLAKGALASLVVGKWDRAVLAGDLEVVLAGTRDSGSMEGLESDDCPSKTRGPGV